MVYGARPEHRESHCRIAGCRQKDVASEGSVELQCLQEREPLLSERAESSQTRRLIFDSRRRLQLRSEIPWRRQPVEQQRVAHDLASFAKHLFKRDSAACKN